MLERLLQGKFMQDCEPFYHRASHDFGVLMFHGLSKSPYQVKELGEYLHSVGISNFGAVIKGHCTKPADLAECTMHDWLEGARNVYEEFSKIYKKRIVLGFSLGGLLALNIGKEYNPDGIISLSAFYKLNMCGNLGFLMGWNKPHPEDLVGYPDMPPKSMYEIIKLMKETRKIIKKIESPIFIAQGTKDARVHKKAANELYKHVKSKKKELMILEDDGHVILKGDNKQKVFNGIHDFILQCI
ncbi:MAG: alpha/beta hydrolase [Nanoarchaeota archaeon]|nr:alpha/beta hydrolase [Nanoarchaeota archaeon]